MHPTQRAILDLMKQHDLGKMSLRQVAKLVGVENSPQIVKHHLLQLEKMGLIQLNLSEGVIRATKRGFSPNSGATALYSLPIVGAANCGQATIFADERIQGHLKVSSSLLPRKKQDLYVLLADGNSMNKASLGDGKTIEDGDFVIVDSSYKNPKDGDIVVSVIDGMANIKRYTFNKADNLIVLQSESTEKHLPIFIHEGDDFGINGKIISVIKQPKYE